MICVPPDLRTVASVTIAIVYGHQTWILQMAEDQIEVSNQRILNAWHSQNLSAVVSFTRLCGIWWPKRCSHQSRTRKCEKRTTRRTMSNNGSDGDMSQAAEYASGTGGYENDHHTGGHSNLDMSPQ